VPKKTPNPTAEAGSTDSKLTEDAQIYVVTALAVWRPLEEILKTLRDDFGVTDYTQQAISYYRPTSAKCPERWKLLHAKARAEFTSRAAEIGIANPAYRLAERHRLYELTVSRPAPNVSLAIEQLNDAARESGGQFTNRQRVEESGPNGGPIEHQHSGQVDFVAAQVFGATGAQLDAILDGHLGGKAEPASPKKLKRSK
jgi:hypothetical protein